MYPFKLGLFINRSEDYKSKEALMDAIRFAADLGITGFQLSANKQLFEFDKDPEFLKELLALCDKLGTELVSVCGDMGVQFHRTDRLEELKTQIERSCDFARRAKMRSVTTHIGVVPSEKTHPRYSVMLDTFRLLAETAEKNNVYLAVETGPEMASVLKMFLDDVNSPAAAVNLDPANIIMSTNEDPVEALKILAPYVKHTHAKDGVFLKPCDMEIMYGVRYDSSFVERDYCRETLLGQGDIDWKAYLDTLENIGYKDYLVIEREGSPSHIKDIVYEAEWLKNMIG